MLTEAMYELETSVFSDVTSASIVLSFATSLEHDGMSSKKHGIIIGGYSVQNNSPGC